VSLDERTRRPGRPRRLEVVVDRVRVEGDARGRLTDSVEIAYQEGGGSAFAIELSGVEGGAPVRHVFSERFGVPPLRTRVRAAAATPLLVQQPVRRLPHLPWLRQHHRARHGARGADPSRSIQQGAIEPWSKPHYRGALTELKRAARARGVRLDVPWMDLTEDERRFVVEGEGGYEGIRGFFAWLERKSTRCTCGCS